MAESISVDEASRFEPGTHGCHEALHMAHVLAEMVSERLYEHPAIESVPEWRALAERAVEALHVLYQAIGARHVSP